MSIWGCLWKNITYEFILAWSLYVTRLGFSLNESPLIMRSKIDSVMSQDKAIKSATSMYIDDIYVNESLLPVAHVREHQSKYGLICKDPERLEDRTRLAGREGKQNSPMKAEQEVTDIPKKMTHQSMFSLCETCGSFFCFVESANCVH